MDVGGTAQRAAEQSAGLYAALFYGAILLVVLVFGAYALLRLSRRYGERLRHKPAEPTPASDVWSMHELPDDNDARTHDREPDDEP